MQQVKVHDVVKVRQVLAKIKAGAAGEAPAPVKEDGGDKADTGRLAVDKESSTSTGVLDTCLLLRLWWHSRRHFVLQAWD